MGEVAALQSASSSSVDPSYGSRHELPADHQVSIFLERRRWEVANVELDVVSSLDEARTRHAKVKLRRYPTPWRRRPRFRFTSWRMEAGDRCRSRQGSVQGRRRHRQRHSVRQHAGRLPGFSAQLPRLHPRGHGDADPGYRQREALDARSRGGDARRNWLLPAITRAPSSACWPRLACRGRSSMSCVTRSPRTSTSQHFSTGT